MANHGMTVVTKIARADTFFFRSSTHNGKFNDHDPPSLIRLRAQALSQALRTKLCCEYTGCVVDPSCFEQARLPSFKGECTPDQAVPRLSLIFFVTSSCVVHFSYETADLHRQPLADHELCVWDVIEVV